MIITLRFLHVFSRFENLKNCDIKSNSIFRSSLPSLPISVHKFKLDLPIFPPTPSYFCPENTKSNSIFRSSLSSLSISVHKIPTRSSDLPSIPSYFWPQTKTRSSDLPSYTFLFLPTNYKFKVNLPIFPPIPSYFCPQIQTRSPDLNLVTSSQIILFKNHHNYFFFFEVQKLEELALRLFEMFGSNLERLRKCALFFAYIPINVNAPCYTTIKSISTTIVTSTLIQQYWS